MNNCLILGSGRSGTSMLAGILYDAGYYMGDRLYTARDANPKGFFEDEEINRINETILGMGAYSWLPGPLRRLRKTTVHRPGGGQGWLACIPSEKNISCDNHRVTRRLKAAVSHTPFAYKDPRFSYTLPVWRPYLDENTVIICMFRDPAVTVASILKECRSAHYLRNLEMDEETAFEIWIAMYSHILEKHRRMSKHFIFLQYDRVYDGSALERLSGILQVPLTGGFVDKGLKRTVHAAVNNTPVKAKNIYETLLNASDEHAAHALSC